MKLKQSFIEIIKYCITGIIKLVGAILSPFFPIKENRVFFWSFYGKQFSCNPKAIYDSLLKEYSGEFECIWTFVEPQRFQFLNMNQGTKICRYRSLKHYYYMFTSKIIVINANISVDMPIRRHQIIIQTWHGGGCYKKVGAAIGYMSSFHNWLLKRKSTKISYFISSSKFFTDDVVRKQYLYSGTVLEIGMPRNDILINCAEKEKKVQDLRKNLGLNENQYLILYAPTFRDFAVEKCESLDLGLLKRAVFQRYQKEPIILFRGHHTEKKGDSLADIDVSHYNDMQELLLMVDMLVTDYSSSIWDFSFTGKPCFLYAADLDIYEKYRGFDKDIQTWGFPVCRTNQELFAQIQSFDKEKYKLAMEKHHQQLGSFERGIASSSICKIMMKSRK